MDDHIYQVIQLVGSSKRASMMQFGVRFHVHQKLYAIWAGLKWWRPEAISKMAVYPIRLP